MRTFISRLLDVILRRQREDRLSEEMQSHLDLLTDEHIAHGLSPDDARLAAHRAFGGVDQTKMRYREQRGFAIVDGLLQDGVPRLADGGHQLHRPGGLCEWGGDRGR